MNVNELMQEVHNNAVNHGWWEEERCFAEIVALCHSELSEALEADRAGQPLMWYDGDKPEGTAVEMADCVIRILDWFGKMGIDAESVINAKHEYNIKRPYKHGKQY